VQRKTVVLTCLPIQDTKGIYRNKNVAVSKKLPSRASPGTYKFFGSYSSSFILSTKVKQPFYLLTVFGQSGHLKL